MDYEEKYNQALERARISRLQLLDIGEEATEIEHIFPELKESEDEKIRKEIIKLVHFFYCSSSVYEHHVSEEDMIAWLKKQGEKSEYNPYKATVESIAEMCKSYSTSTDLHDFYDNVRVKCKDAMEYDKTWTEKQGEQKPTDEIKPKFKVGDWITNGEHTWKVTDIKPLDYILQSQNGDVVDDTISYVDEEFHLWTIEDAKDGDVLFTTCDNTNEMVFIYHGIEFDASNCYFLYSHTRNECKIFNSVCSIKADIRPATKEQCNFLFQKMKEVGYEWDAEKKELKKIYQEYPLTPSECFKPSWSEGDEEMIDFMIEFIESLWWRKDLTQRKDNVLSWLKSLKSKKHWKPSEEQMEALKKRTHGLHESSETRKALESLINDLEKL